MYTAEENFCNLSSCTVKDNTKTRLDKLELRSAGGSISHWVVKGFVQDDKRRTGMVEFGAAGAKSLISFMKARPNCSAFHMRVVTHAPKRKKTAPAVKGICGRKNRRLVSRLER